MHVRAIYTHLLLLLYVHINVCLAVCCLHVCTCMHMYHMIFFVFE